MFPTIGHLFSYLTGMSLHLPVPTFGFFMVLSFAGAWWVFRSEYKRKEAEGVITPLPDPGPIPATIPGGRLLFLAFWAFAGFVVGAKTFYWWINRSFYIGTLPDFLFSFRGSLGGGLVLGLAASLAGWLYLRQQPEPAAGQAVGATPASKGSQATEAVHPYQLMDRLLLYCGLSGFAGAILFAKLEGISGLNYYGALIAGALTFLYINHRSGIPLAVALDIGSPGMMLAYGIGRIGCHLAGDGDWGIVNEAPRPAWLQWAPGWVWSSRFPHNSIHQGMYIPDCTDNYCTILPAPVYPTSFYEAVLCLLFFAALWTLRSRVQRPGLLFAFFALLNGLERFTIEFIRVNPRYPIGSWMLSQAQIIAAGWMIAGLIALSFSLRKRPL